jgi:hypothetical protein
VTEVPAGYPRAPGSDRGPCRVPAHLTATEVPARRPRQPPTKAGVCRTFSPSTEVGGCRVHPVAARATTDRGVRRSAKGVSWTEWKPGSTSISRPSYEPPAEAGDALSDRVLSALPHARPKSGVRSERRHAVLWEIGSSSGPFSPRKFVALRRVFRPSEARCSPGFSILFRGFPLIALGWCFHRPSSHRLGVRSGSRRSLHSRPGLRESRSATSQSVTER